MVADYLNNIDLLRGEDSHIARMMDPYYKVTCSQCRHWTRDEVAAGGIGCCSLHASPNPPCFPNAPRRCFEFQEV